MKEQLVLKYRLCTCNDFNRESRHWLRCGIDCECKLNEAEHYHCPNCGCLKIKFYLRFWDKNQVMVIERGNLRECNKKVELLGLLRGPMEEVVDHELNGEWNTNNYTLTLK